MERICQKDKRDFRNVTERKTPCPNIKYTDIITLGFFLTEMENRHLGGRIKKLINKVLHVRNNVDRF